MLSDEDRRRLRTWALEIVAELRGAHARDEGHDRVWTGGLSIHRRLGWWFNYATGDYGDTLDLIRFLHQDEGYIYADAETWAERWLSNHPGTGSCDGQGDADDPGVAASVSKTKAEDALARAIALEGTEGEVYARSRGLNPPYDFNAVRFLRDARIGEHAWVGILRANGRITGVELRYITSTGDAKSHRRLKVQRWNLEPAKGATFQLTVPDKLDNPSVDLALLEGLPDLLSSEALYARNFRREAVPGIGFLEHVKVAPGTKVTFVAHGDTRPEAIEGRIEGLDSLLLQGAIVNVVEMPDGEDFNSILTKHGPAEVISLFGSAKRRALSPKGEIERLARLDTADFELSIKTEAAKLGIGVTSLRKAVEARRSQLRKAARLTEATETGGVGSREEDPAWTGPINLCDALDSTYAAILRYVDITKTNAAVCTLWSAMAHLVHKPAVELQVCPRLFLNSLFPDSGKTTLLAVICELAPNGEIFTSYSGSSIFRVVDMTKATLGLDEADQVLSNPSATLTEVLNGSHYRKSARVIRVERDASGQHYVATYTTWCAIVFSGLGQLPRTLESRSLSIRLNAASPEANLTDLDYGTSPVLTECRRHLAAWAGTMQRPLPRPSLPAGLRNRRADNWRPLFAIAAEAGGEWPARVLEAAEEALRVPRPETPLHRLLRDIRDAFGPDDRIPTETLLKFLNEQCPESGWYRANNGQQVDPYWLRETLDGVISPAGSKRWWAPVGKPRDQQSLVRGYFFSQFKMVCDRYLDPPVTEAVADEPEVDERFSSFYPPPPGGLSGTSGYTPGSERDLYPHVPDKQGGRGGQKSKKEGSPTDPPSAELTESVRKKLGYAFPGVAEKPSRPARRTSAKRKPANGADTSLPGLDEPVPPPPPSDIDARIRQLRSENPNRSVRWLASKAGQPVSYVKQVIGNGSRPGAPQ